MKILAAFTLALVISATAGAQSTPLTLTGHALGESQADAFKNEQAACDRAKAVESAKPAAQQLARPCYLLGNKEDFTFENDKLVKLTRYSRGHWVTLDQVIEKYGKPTAQMTFDSQNVFGAAWQDVSAVWLLPNGFVSFTENNGPESSITLVMETLEQHAKDHPAKVNLL